MPCATVGLDHGPRLSSPRAGRRRSQKPTSPDCWVCASLPSCLAQHRPRRLRRSLFTVARRTLSMAGNVSETACRLARELDGHYMDQFTFAERATDWRGNNNIAESIFTQMSHEQEPVPVWVVCGAGTGGTSATIGRYIRYRQFATQLCVADPQGSVFHRHFADRQVRAVDLCGSVIEGIGRREVEPSFMPELIDRMIAVPDVASIAAARLASSLLGRPCGGSTGTSLWACLELIEEMRASGARGSIVTLLCDSGERYRSTLFNDDWLSQRGIDLSPARERLQTTFGCSA